MRVVAGAAIVVVLGGGACTMIATPKFGVGTAPVSTTASGKVGQPAALNAAAPGGAASTALAPAATAAPSVASDAPGQRSAAGASSSAATSASTADAASSTTLEQSAAQPLDRMVIRNAQLTVEVGTVEDAVAQARVIAQRGGGFVSASNTRVEKVNHQNRPVADLTIQVRSDAVDSALSELRALGTVTTETSGSQDVTEEYVDLDSNLRNLQASETAVVKLMDKATRIEDVLSLQRELTSIRGQIERIQGRKRFLERRTDMATITLALRLPAVETPSQTGTGWNPIAVAQRGWQASLTLLRGVADVVIVAVAFSWWLVPLVGCGAYVWLHRTRRSIAGPPSTPADA